MQKDTAKLVSFPQIFTSVLSASCFWPWQLTMCGRMKVELCLIRLYKCYFSPALDHPFFPRSMEGIIHFLWPNTWPISESLSMFCSDHLPIPRQAFSFPFSSAEALTVCFLSSEVSSQRTQPSFIWWKGIFIPFILVGIPPNIFPGWLLLTFWPGAHVCFEREQRTR